jgi:hypothetical protein
MDCFADTTPIYIDADELVITHVTTRDNPRRSRLNRMADALTPPPNPISYHPYARQQPLAANMKGSWQKVTEAEQSHAQTVPQKVVPKVHDIVGIRAAKRIPSDYKLIPAGSALATRRAQKASLDAGKDVYIMKKWGLQPMRYGPKRLGIYVPAEIVAALTKEGIL